MRYSFLLIMLLPVAAQIYVTWRVWQMLPLPVWAKVLIAALMTLAFGLFFLALMPQLDRLPMPLAVSIYHIGTSWTIILLYLLMLFVALGLLRICHVLPSQYLHSSWIGTSFFFVFMLLVFTYGYVHYRHKVRVPLELKTQKPLDRPLRIVMTSDWHLGYHNRRAELARWIDLINAEEPDLILIAGDIIDRSIRPLDDEGMAEEFHRLKAPVYACLGNHEYYSGEPQALRFYREAGICLLRDSVANVGPLTIVGRDDRSNPHRRRLSTLVKEVDSNQFIIVLDHQPYLLEEVETAGIDFELAGHTHHGQVWPASWITDSMYECAYGFHRRGNTRFYVSSGIGIWGGKFRIGTQSEYVVATISFN